MPNIPNPYSELLREPNLLIPGKKPVGAVKIDRPHSLSAGLMSYGLASDYVLYDLAAKTTAQFYSNKATLTTSPAGRTLRFNDTTNAEAIVMPYLLGKFDGLTEATVYVRCRFHGNSSTDEDSLFGQWSNLQGAADANGRRVLLRYDSANQEIDIFTYTSVQDGIVVSAPDVDDGNIHDIVYRFKSSSHEVFFDGVSLGSGATTGAALLSTSTSKYLEIMGGHEVTGSTGSQNDSPRFDLFTWGVWNRGLTDVEVRELKFDPYQFLVPA